MSIDEELALLTGLEKLQYGIKAARNGESMSKGNKTSYGIAAKLSDQLIEEYIKLQQDKNKKPHVKGLITFSKNQYIQRGYKVQLYPTKEQEELLIKYVDAYRWTYNYLYADRKNTYKQWKNKCFAIKSYNWFSKKSNYKELPKMPSWSAPYIKKCNLPKWMQNVAAVVINGCVKSFPKKPSGFRKKNKALSEFCIHQGDNIIIGKDFISVPLIGNIKHSRSNYIPLDIKVSILGVSLKNNKWYAGISGSLKQNKPELKSIGKIVGIDVGVRKLSTSWDGFNNKVFSFKENIENRLLKLDKNRIRWQRKLSKRANKDINGKLLSEQSKRYLFALNKISSIYNEIYNISNNNTNKISSRLTGKDTKEIIIEDLHVSGMLSNGKKDKKVNRKLFHKLIAKSSMARLLGQIVYKSSWRGIKITKANRFFPSSKLCSSCHMKNSDLRSEETWICPNCNVKHNRDENASKNLQNYTNPCWSGFYKNLEIAKINKRSSGLAGSIGQVVQTKPKHMDNSRNIII